MAAGSGSTKLRRADPRTTGLGQGPGHALAPGPGVLRRIRGPGPAQGLAPVRGPPPRRRSAGRAGPTARATTGHGLAAGVLLRSGVPCPSHPLQSDRVRVTTDMGGRFSPPPRLVGCRRQRAIVCQSNLPSFLFFSFALASRFKDYDIRAFDSLRGWKQINTGGGGFLFQHRQNFMCSRLCVELVDAVLSVRSEIFFFFNWNQIFGGVP